VTDFAAWAAAARPLHPDGSAAARRRAFGITPSSAASRARSAQASFGRRGCRRCGTASWWRRIKISAVFHVSSGPDSRSHAASRVIKRNTNRRHMTGDHHEPSAGRATLLVRAVDAILGTHNTPRFVCLRASTFQAPFRVSDQAKPG